MGWTEAVAGGLADVLSRKFERDGVVVAVAAVDESDTAVVGALAGMEPDSRFEIGSVTKLMTATLLALLAGRGRLGLDDEIGQRLAAGLNGGLTVLQLATQIAFASGAQRLRIAILPTGELGGFTFLPSAD